METIIKKQSTTKFSKHNSKYFCKKMIKNINRMQDERNKLNNIIEKVKNIKPKNRKKIN